MPHKLNISLPEKQNKTNKEWHAHAGAEAVNFLNNVQGENKITGVASFLN